MLSNPKIKDDPGKAGHSRIRMMKEERRDEIIQKTYNVEEMYEALEERREKIVIKSELMKRILRGKQKNKNRTLIDTGATISATSERDILLDEKGCIISIQGINGVSKYDRKGTVVGEVLDSLGRKHKVKSEGVIYIEEAGETILSYHKFWRKGGFLLNDTEEMPFLYHKISGSKILLERDQDGLLYVEVDFTNKASIRKSNRRSEMDIKDFHAKVGHVSNIKELKRKATAMGITLVGVLACLSCDIVNYQKDSIKSRGQSRVLVQNKRRSWDLCGPIILKHNGREMKMYAGLLADDATRYVDAVTVPYKSAACVLPALEKALDKVEIFGKVEVLRADMARETWGKEIKTMLAQRKIRLEGTGPRSPELNSVVEGKIWRVFKKMLIMLEASGCGGNTLTPEIFKHIWNMSAYWINKAETQANIDNRSPMEMYKLMTNQKVRECFVGNFGMMVIVENINRRKGNLDKAGEIGVIVGIDLEVVGKEGCDGAAVILKVESNTYTTTQHHKLPKGPPIYYWKQQGEIGSAEIKKNLTNLLREINPNFREEREDVGVTVAVPIIEDENGIDSKWVEEDGKYFLNRGEGEQQEIIEIQQRQEDAEGGMDMNEEEDIGKNDNYNPPVKEETLEESLNVNNLPITSIRNREPKGNDAIVNQEYAEKFITGTVKPGTRSGGNFHVLKSYSEEEIIESGLERIFRGKQETTNNKPQKYGDICKIEDAREREEWKKAANKELDDLYETDSIRFVPIEERDKSIEVINSDIILDEKVDNVGKITKKARLVAKEMARKTKYKYTDQELFSPVVGVPSLKSALAFATTKGNTISLWDVSQAFTSTRMEESKVVYIKNVSFENKHDGGKEGVLRTMCYLYGTRVAAAKFNEKINRFFVSVGLKRSVIDSCLYYKKSETTGRWLLVNIHVDDVIPIGVKEDKEDLQKEFGKKFLYTDNTEEQRILGVKVTHDETAGIVEMNQKDYICKMASEFGIYKSRKIPIPFKLEGKLDAREKELVDQKLYMQMVGSILYVGTMTRADIMLYTSFLCKSMAKPTTHHLEVAVSVIEYLLGSSSKSLTFSRQKEPEMQNKLLGWGDGGGVAMLENGRSRIAYLVMMNGGAIIAKSTETDYVESSMLAIEFIASFYAYRELLALSNLHEDFNNQGKVLTLFSDNESNIYVANKPGQTKKSRLIRLAYWGLREACDEGSLEIVWCPSKRMLADIGTKLMGSETFVALADMVLGRIQWSVDGAIKWFRELTIIQGIWERRA